MRRRHSSRSVVMWGRGDVSTSSSGENLLPLRVGLVQSDNSIVALRANQTRFPAALRVVVDVVDHADGQVELTPDLLVVEMAIEIDPFAAVCAPCLPAIGLGDAGGVKSGS